MRDDVDGGYRVTHKELFTLRLAVYPLSRDSAQTDEAVAAVANATSVALLMLFCKC